MKEFGKDVLIDLLHTNAGTNALNKTVSGYVIVHFKRVVSDDIISAQKYYVGNPDGKFITKRDFDETTVEAKKAYETINTLMGNEKAEFMRFSEGKKQTPGLISEVGLQKIIDMVVLLFVFSNNDEDVTYDTVRACRQTEIAETEEGKYDMIDALQSSTKASIEEIMALGYGNKNKLAICKFHFHKGAVVLDMARFDSDYLKPEEKEVLLLTGNRYVAKCLGYDSRYIGKDGNPGLVYEVDVYAPDYFCKLYDTSDEASLRADVFDKDMIKNVRAFYEALNSNIGGDYPDEPAGYREWKEKFKTLLYMELDKIYK